MRSMRNRGQFSDALLNPFMISILTFARSFEDVITAAQHASSNLSISAASSAALLP